MALKTLEPNPAWTTGGHEETIETLESYNDELVYKVWGGDWCKDCRALLPDFGAALEAAAVPDERIEEFALDQDKQGPEVEAYDVEYIPTIVVERDDGEEVARFVESESLPPAVYLAERIDAELE